MPSTELDDIVFLDSNNSAEQPSPQPKPLRGFFAFYLTNKPIKITFPQKQKGILRLRPGVLAKIRTSTSPGRIILPNEAEVLTMVPRRGTTKSTKSTRSPTTPWSRRFVLILYRPFKKEFKRKKFSRLIEKTPVIRLRPGVVIVPQIRAARFQTYQEALLRPSQFIFNLIELGSPVWYARRLELFHPSSEVLIENLIKSTIEKRVSRLVHACRQLYYDLSNHLKTGNSANGYQKRYMHIRRSVRNLRWQARFFKEEFGIDAQNAINRVTSAISRVYQKLKLCDSLNRS